MSPLAIFWIVAGCALLGLLVFSALWDDDDDDFGPPYLDA